MWKTCEYPVIKRHSFAHIRHNKIIVRNLLRVLFKIYRFFTQANGIEIIGVFTKKLLYPLRQITT